MSKRIDDDDAYFVLEAWCTVAKAWQDTPGRYPSMQDAERVATETGIYRVTYVNAGRRCSSEPFARVPDG